jgi:hypothetical protein
VKKIVAEIFDRNLAAWEQDNSLFTATAKKKPKRAKAAKKVVKKKTAKSAKKPKRR